MVRSVTVLPITVLAITVKQVAHRRLTSHDCHAPLATNRPADLDPGGLNLRGRGSRGR